MQNNQSTEAKRDHRQDAGGGKSVSKGERAFLVAICVVAALRVFFFNAAFPLFNNVDEQAHVDLVLKYSRGHVPTTGLENYSRESAEMFVLYGTSEYFASKEDYPDLKVFPPPWLSPKFKESPIFEKEVSDWTKRINHEAASFPTYYVLAGTWCAVGRTLGLQGGHLLYWIRFLNVPLFVLLVWVCCLFGRSFFPDRPMLRLGLPLIMAFHPQDIFYSINGDALSPLLFAGSLLMLLGPGRRERTHTWHLITGLAIAATFLIKPSNIAIAFILGIVVLLDCRKAARRGEFRNVVPKLATLLVAAGLPVAIWLTRNYFVLGSITGAAEKISYLTWTAKPFTQMWDHPIFSPSGAAYFINGIGKTFWRGEFVWFLEPMAYKGVDLFYVVSSVCLVLISLPTLLRIRKPDSPGPRIIGVCFISMAISLLFMSAISIAYDFGQCWAPSREFPYFLAGRLISCALVPFLIVYLDGLDRLLAPLRLRVNPLFVLALIIAVITCSELSLAAAPIRSAYNWYHLF